MTRVLHITEIDEGSLFLVRAFLLGDPSGSYFVVDEDNTPLARYRDKKFAEVYSEIMNDTTVVAYQHMPLEELVKASKRMLTRLRHEIGKNSKK